MPRNSSGVYSLPESPFVAGTTIDPVPVNSDFSDIATALTGSLAVDGSSAMTGVLRIANGAVATPSLTFTNSTGTGWYRISNNVIGYVVAGVLAYTVDADRIVDMEVGLRVGNSDVVDTTVLDWYEEGTFLPTINFNGVTTGITYGSQDGIFTRIGDRVFFDIVIVLTSKGAAAGDLIVDGLPYAIESVAVGTFAIVDGFAAGVGDTSVFLRCDPTFAPSGEIKLYNIDAGAGEAFPLTDADVTNTAAFRLNGHYKADV